MDTQEREMILKALRKGIQEWVSWAAWAGFLDGRDDYLDPEERDAFQSSRDQVRLLLSQVENLLCSPPDPEEKATG